MTDDIDYLHEAIQNSKATPTTVQDYLGRAQAFALIAITQELRSFNTGYSVRLIADAIAEGLK